MHAQAHFLFNITYGMRGPLHNWITNDIIARLPKHYEEVRANFFLKRDHEIRIPRLRGGRRHRRGSAKPSDGTIEELFDCSRPRAQHQIERKGYGDDGGCDSGCGSCGSCEGSCGGSWGDAGAANFSGFNADAWGSFDTNAAAAFDAAFTSNPTGGGDWGSFGTYSAAGQNIQDPNNINTDLGRAFDSPYATASTGGGDWGSFGSYTSGLQGTGEGAGYYGSTGGGLYGGGGLFGGNQGGGLYGQPDDSGGSYSGGGGGGGGRSGGGVFGGDQGGGRSGGGRAGGEAAPLGGAARPSADTDSEVGGEAAPLGGAEPESSDEPATGSPAGLPSQADAPSDEGAPQSDSEAPPAQTESSQPTQTESRSEGLGTLAAAMAHEATSGVRGGAELFEGAPTGGNVNVQSLVDQGGTPGGWLSTPVEDASGRMSGDQPFGSYDQTGEGRGGPAYSESFAPAYSPSYDQTFNAVTAPSGMDIAGDQGTAALGWGMSPALADALQTLSQNTQTALTPSITLPEVTVTAAPTYTPNFDQAFGPFAAAPGWNPSEQTAGRAGLAEPTDWGGNPLAADTNVNTGRDFNQVYGDLAETLSGQDLAADQGLGRIGWEGTPALTFNEMWGDTPYNTLPNDPLSRSAQETLLHDFSYFPNPGYVQGPPNQTWGDRAYQQAQQILGTVLSPAGRGFDLLLSLPNPLAGVPNPADTLSNAASNFLLGGPNIQSLNPDAIAQFEAGQQGRQGQNYIMDTPFVSPAMPTQTVNVDFMPTQPEAQPQAPPAAPPPQEAQPQAQPEAPPAAPPPQDAQPAPPPQEAPPAAPPQEAPPAAPPQEAPPAAPPQVVTDITTPQSLLDLGGVPPPAQPAPPAREQPQAPPPQEHAEANPPSEAQPAPPPAEASRGEGAESNAPPPGTPQGRSWAPVAPSGQSSATRPPPTAQERSEFTNWQLDRPGNPFYQDRGLWFPQGRPGQAWRTAEQAGVQPLFNTRDHNWRSLDARLVERLNRAYEAMPADIRSSFALNSAYRPATRADARAVEMSDYQSQESVYARGHAPGGRHFASARPGNSNHGQGRAVDVQPGAALNWLQTHGRQFGLTGIGRGDWPHIQMMEGGARADARGGPFARGRQAAANIPLPPARPPSAPVGDPNAPRPPLDVPQTALPPQAPAVETPITRPPADVPPPTQLVPPARGVPDQAMMARAASQIAQDMAAAGKRPTSQAEGQAALNSLAAALGKASIPNAIALRTLTEIARAGSKAAGYDPDGIASSFISSMVNSAMQNYRAAPFAGEVQGPPQQRGLAKGGRVEKGEAVTVGEEGPETFVPDEPGTVFPYVPPASATQETFGRWPRVALPGAAPGTIKHIGLGGYIQNQNSAAQYPSGLLDLMNAGALRINPNWDRMLADPRLQAMGRARIEDRRNDPYY